MTIAARAALADSQLRHNLARATHTIRDSGCRTLIFACSRAAAAGICLPAFDFQMTKPQPGSSRDQHE